MITPRHALALLLLAACGDDEASAPNLDAGLSFDASLVDAFVPTREQLEGRDYLLHAAQGYEPLDDVHVRLRFQQGELRVNAGCNGQFGAFTIEAGSLVAPPLQSTLVACIPESLHAQDAWFARFLTSRPRITIATDWLVLTTDEATLTFLDRELADPDRPLVGTRWTGNSYLLGSGEVGLALTREPTLVFRQDGRFEVATPCNKGGGAYTVRDGSLLPSDASFTDAACKSAGDHDVDQLLKTLFTSSTLRFEVEASRLTLRNDAMLGLRAFSE